MLIVWQFRINGTTQHLDETISSNASEILHYQLSAERKMLFERTVLVILDEYQIGWQDYMTQ